MNLNLHLTGKSQLILKLLRKYVLLKGWFILFNKRNSILTVFFPMLPFDPHENRKQRFSDVFRTIKRDHWEEKG